MYPDGVVAGTGEENRAYLKLWILRRRHAVHLQNIILQPPELSIAPLLLPHILVHSNVDYRSCGCTWREQYRRELDQMGSFAQQYLLETSG